MESKRERERERWQHDGLIEGTVDASLSLTRRGSWNRLSPPLHLCVYVFVCVCCYTALAGVAQPSARSGCCMCVCLSGGETSWDKRVIECLRLPGVSEWTTGTRSSSTHTHTHINTFSCTSDIKLWLTFLQTDYQVCLPLVQPEINVFLVYMNILQVTWKV